MTINALLTHEAPDRVARMVAGWRERLDLDDDGLLVVYGGPRERFEAVAHPHRVFVEDPRLRTRRHQHERQSYTGAFQAVAGWLADRPHDLVHFAEYDQYPVARDLDARHRARLASEGPADVLGFCVQRVDDTSNPHWLHHAADPAFGRFWERLTCRRDPRVVLSMLGCGSVWRREAFDAVAATGEPLPVYLELFLPTAAHHLGFRVRDVPDQAPFMHPARPYTISDLPALERDGAWCAHPIKEIWASPHGDRTT